jgi:hypothetical protein
MEHDDEELRLAPIEEDELGLAPIEDEDAKKQIAPEIPYNTGIRLIPVTCSACKTRLYAGENQVGLWKRCPDCECLTEIRAVLPKFILTANDPEAAGGYNIQEPAVSKKDIIQLKTENQKSFEEYREQQNQKRIENRLPPPIFIDQPPVMEGMFNRLLKSNEEKNEEHVLIQRQLEIEKETEAVRRAARNGTLETYLAGSENAEHTKHAEHTENVESTESTDKKFPFDTATSLSIPSPPSSHSPSSPPLPPPSAPSSTPTLSSTLPPSPSPSPTPIPPPLPTRMLTVFPPPLPFPTGSALPVPSSSSYSSSDFRSSHSRSSGSRSSGSHSSAASAASASGFLWSPLLDRRCRSRMIVLTVCGFLGNFTGEKARSMIWQVVFDKVYGKYAGYSYNLAESGFFLVNFWFGAVLSVIWLTMLFLLGISLFLETADGKDNVEHWVPFDLNFGCSYVGWSLLILFASGFPGFIVWQGTVFFLPDKESLLVILHYAGQFLCFPVLFLCVIESDTFYGNFPHQTLTSLYRFPGLWLQLYWKATVLVGIPETILAGLLFAGTVLPEHWLMQSVFYYLIAAVLLTFCGYFVLLYFRLLGKTAWEIRKRTEKT